MLPTLALAAWTTQCDSQALDCRDTASCEQDLRDGEGSAEGGDDGAGGDDECGDEGGGAHGPATYFIATDGSDAAAGTITAPFATFDHAIALAQPGDTIYVRGGVYDLDHVVTIDTAGTAADPIRLWAYDGEQPILDFASNPRHADPPQPRDDDSIAATSEAVGVFVGGNAQHWHLRGLEIRNAPYYGVRIYGSDNVFDQLVLHDHKASGLEITGKDGWSPSDNLVVDCDSFHNFDPQSNGEDADGFAAKFDGLGEGNVFRRTRSWSNADDGYDFWHAAPVLIEGCWAFDNGFNRPEWASQLTASWKGDGMGFKLGQDADELELHGVVAFGNKAFGIDGNGNGSAGGVSILNATVVNNTKSGNPLQINLVDGAPHTVRNSIAFDVDGPGVVNISGPVDHAFNSWNGLGVSAADFQHLDMNLLRTEGQAPRGTDGSLPPLGLALAPTSGLIDAGQNVGLPFVGPAPDLGAFETD